MDAVKIAADGSSRLPPKVLRQFPSHSELAVWSAGDMIVLTRVHPLKPTSFARRRPAEEMPLEEIDAEVQAHRKAKRAKKA